MRDTRPNNADDLKPRESRWETPDPTMQMTWSPENLDERHQTQQCRWPEGRYQSNLGFITPEQCHRLIVSMPRRIDAVIHAKGAPTKYWVHRNEHTFHKPDISVSNMSIDWMYITTYFQLNWLQLTYCQSFNANYYDPLTRDHLHKI